MSTELRNKINYDSHRFGWRNILNHSEYVSELRKYSFKDSADLIIELLKKIKEKTGKETIKILDFGCSQGTPGLVIKPPPFVEWNLDHNVYVIIMLQRTEYPFNEFFTLHHMKAWDNEMFLGYLDIIGWETINYYHVDWRSKWDSILVAIPRCFHVDQSVYGMVGIARN